MWPCRDFTSSDDDKHNTDNSFLLLFADIGITPTLLEGLTEVDVLHIALGCRFALDIFTVSQQHAPTPDLEPPPLDPDFEHGCYTRLVTVTKASLLGPRSWKGLTLYVSLSVWEELVVTQCQLKTC